MVLAAAGANNLSLSDFYSMLLSCESLKEQNAFAPEFFTSANAVARQGDGRGGGASSSTPATTAAAGVVLLARKEATSTTAASRPPAATSAPTKGVVVVAMTEEDRAMAA
ncbi:hypothetical protein ZWY2020_037504 [Hordeum vulgare]|nr:hypothetical protein ZWY2020_037504 [Hordeum vulgare]